MAYGLMWGSSTRVAGVEEQTQEKEKMITEEQIAYLAGFVDGEACISITRVGTLSIAVSQVQKEPLDLLTEVVGKAATYMAENKKTGQRGIWIWQTSGERAVRLISLLQPYLRMKKEQAKAVLYLSTLPCQERITHRHLVTCLNKTGREGAKYGMPETAAARFVAPKWSSIESAYHAGVFDAEGCVNAANVRNALRVIVVQMDPRTTLLDLARDFAVKMHYGDSSPVRNTRRLYRVQLTGDRGYVYLSLIRRYLLVKDKQADVFLEWYDVPGVKAKQPAVDRLHVLNLTGLRPTVTERIASLVEKHDPCDVGPYTAYWQPETLLSTVPDVFSARNVGASVGGVGEYWHV